VDQVKTSIEHVDDGTELGARRVTITYSREEQDPSGKVGVLAITGQLGEVLEQIGHSNDVTGVPASRTEYETALAAVGEVLSVLEQRRALLLLAGRDQHDYSWRDLERLCGQPYSTCKRWVLASRDGFARLGVWFDGAALHIGTPEQARTALAGADAHDELLG
jgi:hypothetical protein